MIINAPHFTYTWFHLPLTSVRHAHTLISLKALLHPFPPYPSFNTPHLHHIHNTPLTPLLLGRHKTTPIPLSLPLSPWTRFWITGFHPSPLSPSTLHLLHNFYAISSRKFESPLPFCIIMLGTETRAGAANSTTTSPVSHAQLNTRLSKFSTD